MTLGKRIAVATVAGAFIIGLTAPAEARRTKCQASEPPWSAPTAPTP